VVDLWAEANLARLLVEAGRGGYLTSAHDMSDGGLAQTLVESCLRHGIGATVSLLGDPFVGLFSESAARAVVTVEAEKLDSFLTMAASLGVPSGEIGRTGGPSFVVTDRFDIPLDELGAAWRGTLPAAFGH
jgi:phosphoribosylformylglycinamidine synthase